MTKTCTVCKEIKDVAKFRQAKGGKYGVRGECITCGREKSRLYYHQHLKERAQYSKQYRQTEKGKKADHRACRRYRQTEKGKVAYSKGNAKYYKTPIGYLKCIYRTLNRRCTDPKRKDYKWYGGRGIENRFKSFEDFFDYVVNNLGFKSFEQLKGLQIDRVNNDGHYARGNIRFVTAKVNMNNRGTDAKS